MSRSRIERPANSIVTMSPRGFAEVDPVDPHACPLCDQPAQLVGHAIYYTRDARFPTPIFHCRSCDVYCRRVDRATLDAHQHAASYVDLRNERKFLEHRESFFEFLLATLDQGREPRRDANKLVLADFGCSYGHMLHAAEKHGYRAVGIEVNQDILAVCRSRGLNVYRAVEDVPGAVDVFALIDSLYYVPDPKQLLRAMRDKLAPAGLLIVRVTNRNQYVRIRNWFTRGSDYSALGDCMVAYSLAGITRLLNAAGFHIERVLPDRGQGKRMPAAKKLFYKLSNIAYVLSAGRISLSPGFIVVARVAP
jgi:SAM-dependent methyltransferase